MAEASEGTENLQGCQFGHAIIVQLKWITLLLQDCMTFEHFLETKCSIMMLQHL